MRTFRINKVQNQSYYAIRVFGIVHLVAAIGLVVLLDGPGDGLGGFSRTLLVVLALGCAWLGFRIYQAAAFNRIYGHYVLTKRTLAIKMPGVARVFVRRCDCFGVIPGRWELRVRGGRHVSLRSASWRPYKKRVPDCVVPDMVAGFCGI